MDPSKHSLRTIFAEALDIQDQDQRAAFVERACGPDMALRQEIDGLLRAEAAAAPTFLPNQSMNSGAQRLSRDAVIFDSSSARPPAFANEKPGDQIGRYKLLEQIGEGGCGVVYLAEQQEPVRRQVALKVIKLGMDTKQVVARFELERQALALMDHPHIAKVLDAGATDAGRPYFVMELVRGAKITDFCETRNLSTRQRLELFIQVCQAVQHAHQKGIIHRDLKPSNILVTKQDGLPVPKVIDFGIAKAEEKRLIDGTLFTAFEQLLGTPGYMSPEQAALATMDVDTRSDIYSLGVLLYELLIGKTPFDTQDLLKAGFDEMRRTIREKELPRPSTRLSQELVRVTPLPRSNSGQDRAGIAGGPRPDQIQELIPLLRGDLDWIVMKCLEKDSIRLCKSAPVCRRTCTGPLPAGINARVPIDQK